MESSTASTRTDELRLHGIGVSPGIVNARVHLVGLKTEEPENRRISTHEIEHEKHRLKKALRRTREQIEEIRKNLEATGGGERALIFDAHLLVLDDAMVLDEVRRAVETQLRSVDRIYYEVTQRYLESLRKIADPYLRERAVDIEDVSQRVLRNLRFPDGEGGGITVSGSLDAPHIMVARDLTPSDTVSLDRETMLGFATEGGSSTSHTAIIARSLNLPAVIGIHALLKNVREGDPILIDGYHGIIVIRPSENTLAEFAQIESVQSSIREDLESLRDQDTKTLDGRVITLSANIEFVEELPQVAKVGAEGVGLYRTEFFYINEAELRSEERQYENYAQIAENVSPHGVIIRTLDLGGDKLFPEEHDTPEPNPFLGWRGIRVSVDRPEMFKTQLRAILRASARGKVRIMYPFISCIEEVREANRLLGEVRSELDRADIRYDHDLEVGAMIEIPSAVLIADAIAKEVDFFSIGTNDLIQYSTAVDRVNERVANLYQPSHPAVLRLIQMTVEAGQRHGIWTGVCGEVAGDVRLTPALIGAGVDELSVGAAQVLPVRRAVAALDTAECRELLQSWVQMDSAADIFAACNAVAQDKYPELLG